MPHRAINFHYVGMATTPHPGIHGLSTEDFRDTIKTLHVDWNFVSLADIQRAIVDGESLPEDACLITFDDGLYCQFEFALPVLDELGIPAAFFVLGAPYSGQAATVHKLHYVRAQCGDSVVEAVIASLATSGAMPERLESVNSEIACQHYRYDTAESARLKYFLNYVAPAELTEQVTNQLLANLGMTETDFINAFYMTPDMVRDLGSRGYLGSHAESHRPLALMGDKALNGELVRSRQILEEISGTDVVALSYPLGNVEAVDRRVADASQQAGYLFAWTMERAINQSLYDPLMLARLDAADIGRINEFGPRQRYFSEA